MYFWLSNICQPFGDSWMYHSHRCLNSNEGSECLFRLCGLSSHFVLGPKPSLETVLVLWTFAGIFVFAVAVRPPVEEQVKVEGGEKKKKKKKGGGRSGSK